MVARCACIYYSKNQKSCRIVMKSLKLVAQLWTSQMRGLVSQKLCC